MTTDPTLYLAQHVADHAYTVVLGATGDAGQAARAYTVAHAAVYAGSAPADALRAARHATRSAPPVIAAVAGDGDGRD